MIEIGLLVMFFGVAVIIISAVTALVRGKLDPEPEPDSQLEVLRSIEWELREIRTMLASGGVSVYVMKDHR